MINLFDKEFDNVINGVVANGVITYSDALKNLVPLINRTDFQRKLQDKNFYQKLERDIEKGCVMPPITVAFVTDKITKDSSLEDILNFIKDNIAKSFILDGIQRLNTMSRVATRIGLIYNQWDTSKKLYVNFLFSSNNDRLLYRMITLNNGQRPMTPRHQVEVMMSNLKILDTYGIDYRTEKEDNKNRTKWTFDKSDLIQAYLAFMANSPLVDNKKIIQEKMDELLVGRIMIEEANDESRFVNVLAAISKFQQSPLILTWLKVSNNLIGFSVGMRKSAKIVLNTDIEDFEKSISNFEAVFKSFDTSKIKIGKLRRELSCEFFRNYESLKDSDTRSLSEYFINFTHD